MKSSSSKSDDLSEMRSKSGCPDSIFFNSKSIYYFLLKLFSGKLSIICEMLLVSFYFYLGIFFIDLDTCFSAIVALNISLD